MRRSTLIAASVISVLVIGYGGWLSSANSGAEPGGSGGDETSQTGKPGEAPKE